MPHVEHELLLATLVAADDIGGGIEKKDRVEQGKRKTLFIGWTETKDRLRETLLQVPNRCLGVFRRGSFGGQSLL